MSNINVSYQQIDSAATRLQAGRNEIVEKLSRLKHEIDELVTSGFVTEKASSAYRNHYEAFNSGATKTIEGLDGLAAFLRGTAAAMQELDAQLASRLGG